MHFFEEPQVRVHDVPGVLGFQLFPPEGAKALIELTEAWSSSSLAEGWNENPDSVDSQPEWQLDVFMAYTVKGGGPAGKVSPELRWDSEAEPDNPNYEAVKAVLPLAKALCLDMLPPFLSKHRVASDTCNQVFLRKYRADGRPKLAAHQDDSIFTLNVALSDYREVEGGELFMCRQLPQTLAWVMQLEMCDFRDRAQGSHCQQYIQPFARIASSERGAEACMKAQGRQGEAVSSFGSRLHGVFPTTEGTRYSLILFIGRNPGSEVGPGTSQGERAETWLSEPFEKSHVAELPRTDLLIWLTIMSGFSTLAARGELPITSSSIHAFYHELAAKTTSGQRGASERFAIEDLVLALKYFWEDVDVVALALRSIHALLTGEIMGLPAQRPVVLASPVAVEFTRKAVSAHSERFDIGRLGCAVLENLLCGPGSDEECTERAPECEEDPDLWEHLEVEPEVHGSQAMYAPDSPEVQELYHGCFEEAKTLEGADATGQALSPDCFLFVPLGFMNSDKADTQPRGASETGGEL